MLCTTSNTACLNECRDSWSSHWSVYNHSTINIQAKSPEQVSASDEALAINNNLLFLKQCLTRIKQVEFIDADSSTVYLTAVDGKFQITNDRNPGREQNPDRDCRIQRGKLKLYFSSEVPRNNQKIVTNLFENLTWLMFHMGKGPL